MEKSKNKQSTRIQLEWNLWLTVFCLTVIGIGYFVAFVTSMNHSYWVAATALSVASVGVVLLRFLPRFIEQYPLAVLVSVFLLPVVDAAFSVLMLGLELDTAILVIAGIVAAGINSLIVIASLATIGEVFVRFCFWFKENVALE
jgi:hypothetical protein